MGYIRVAKQRTNTQLMEAMFSQRKTDDAKAAGDLAPAVSGNKVPLDEPEDVYSIDGDSEQKIIEIIENDNQSEKSDAETLDLLKSIEELVEDDNSDKEEDTTEVTKVAEEKTLEQDTEQNQ